MKEITYKKIKHIIKKLYKKGFISTNFCELTASGMNSLIHSSHLYEEFNQYLHIMVYDDVSPGDYKLVVINADKGLYISGCKDPSFIEEELKIKGAKNRFLTNLVDLLDNFLINNQYLEISKVLENDTPWDYL